MTEKTIVKVQVFLATTENQKMALIYGKDRHLPEEVPFNTLPTKVRKDMGTRVKAFYYAKKIMSANNEFLGWSLKYQAPWQEW